MVRFIPLLLLPLLACDDTTEDAPDAAPAEEVACTLGLGMAEGEFETLDAEGALELLQGFQGLLVVLPRMRVEGPAAPMDAAFSVKLEGEAPFGGAQADTLLFEAQGASVTEDIVVFMSPTDISLFKDKRADLTIKLSNVEHTCTVQREVLLVDRETCIHATDDPVCPDAGVSE